MARLQDAVGGQNEGNDEADYHCAVVLQVVRVEDLDVNLRLERHHTDVEDKRTLLVTRRAQIRIAVQVKHDRSHDERLLQVFACLAFRSVFERELVRFDIVQVLQRRIQLFPERRSQRF